MTMQSSNTLRTGAPISVRSPAPLFDALSVVYGEKEKRSLLRFYSTTFLLTLGMIALVMAAIGAVVVAPIILTFIGFVTPAEQFVAILRWPVVLVIACAWLAVIYRYGPQPRECQVALGDLGQCHGRDTLAWGVDAVLLVCCQLRQLQQNLWLARCRRRLHGLDLAVGVIVLLGAEMEHQTAEDSTQGTPKPLGSRGGHMADHVGASYT
jgi:membrane protein